jgi:8-oxo-dGTP pyrophosphatase MutT (NUDIX family)
MPVKETAIVQPRLAATVLLVRDAPVEVLMVKRNERGPFASAFVFPGGVVEKNDYSDSWLPYLQCGEPATAEDRALRIAACRETWEEVSILPGGGGDSIAKSATPRSHFFEYVARGGIRLALTKLVQFSHWITPLSAPKRFDTHFFICRTDSTHPGQCDGTETVALEWIQPREALASAERGDRSFLLPTHENLRLLAESANADEALESARNRAVLPIMPRRVVIGDRVTFTVIPEITPKGEG